MKKLILLVFVIWSLEGYVFIWVANTAKVMYPELIVQTKTDLKPGDKVKDNEGFTGTVKYLYDAPGASNKKMVLIVDKNGKEKGVPVERVTKL